MFTTSHPLDERRSSRRNKATPSRIPRPNSLKIPYPNLAYRDFSTTPQPIFPI
jgi:hypothetical protein